MIRKLAAAGAIVIGVVALVAGPAFAHVEIQRDGAVGADGAVATTLNVPNEEANAGTVKVELVFPASPALTVAEPAVVSGWTATVQKSSSGDVQQVTWTGGPLTGDKKVALPLKIAAIPAGVKTVEFKALQTYDNGDVVRWIEVTPAGGQEPEHPAPVLTARGKQALDAPATTASTGASGGEASGTKSSSDSGLSSGAIIAIIVGIVIVLALLGFVLSRSRRDMGSTSD